MKGMEVTHQFQESLKKLKQTGSIADYQKKFETLSTKIHGIPERWLVYFFIVGLEDFLKCQLCLNKPASYSEVVALARLHERNRLGLKNLLKEANSALASIGKPKGMCVV